MVTETDRAIIAHLDQSYSEADLDRICQALGLIPCDPSATLIREVFETLHASCARGWRGDPLVAPPWKTSILVAKGPEGEYITYSDGSLNG